ncbi:MAG: alpha/beta hydrolase fold domain-containing protein [Chloroflexota bacterium]
MENTVAVFRGHTAAPTPPLPAQRQIQAPGGVRARFRLPVGRARRSALLLTSALLTLATAAIYIWAVAYVDRPVDAPIGWLLTAAGAAQAIAAVLMVVRPDRRVLAAAAGMDLAFATIWGISRTVGLPLLAPWSPWHIGVADLTCTIFELLAALALWRLAVRPALPRTPWLAVRAVLALPPAFVIILALVLFSKLTADIDVPAPALSSVRIVPGRMTTFTYCVPGRSGLAMDFYAPPASATRPAPVLLQIHGGAGVFGDRKDIFFPGQIRQLSASGFAVASIDYRRAPMDRMAREIVDAKCAARFLRANASTLGIDPSRIGAYGGSEGGWGAAMLGLAPQSGGFDQGQYLGYSSRVQAVVDAYGPSDFRTLHANGPKWIPILGAVLNRGSSPSDPSNSSVDYVTPEAPPFLIMHGTRDRVIPFRQSVELTQRLRAAGVPVQFVTVQNGPHGLADRAESPNPTQLARMVTRFFVRTLHAGAG